MQVARMPLMLRPPEHRSFNEGLPRVSHLSTLAPDDDRPRYVEGRNPLIIEDLDVYARLPRVNRAPTRNSQEPGFHNICTACRGVMKKPAGRVKKLPDQPICGAGDGNRTRVISLED